MPLSALDWKKVFTIKREVQENIKNTIKDDVERRKVESFHWFSEYQVGLPSDSLLKCKGTTYIYTMTSLLTQF